MKAAKLDISITTLSGRTFEEYKDMFRLTDFIGKGQRILDVASGVSTFCADAAKNGIDAAACDPLYGYTAQDIESAALYKLDAPLGNLCSGDERLADANTLKEKRKAALRTFLKDYDASPSRYYGRAFPDSGFDSGEFTAALSSHFLFTYDGIYDYDFHKRTILEMLRITSKEVRICPLVNLSGERSPFVHRIVNEIFNMGYGISIDKVHGFEKDSEMLRIMK